MYITREGDPYFKSILSNLQENERGRFFRNLKKEGAKVMGVGFKKITIENYVTRDREHVDEKEIITQEMMRRAYWAIWEGREDYELADWERYSPFASWNEDDKEMAAVRNYILARRQEERSRC
jgi:hypothetical protein